MKNAESVKKVSIQITNQFNVKQSISLFEFLQLKLPTMSRNNIKHLLTNKQVLLDGAAVSQFNFMLSKGDIVQISKYPVRNTKSSNKKELPEILYEDDEMIAINKPAGLLSISNEKEIKETAFRIIQDYVCLKNPKNRIYVVHRIDKETSGVLVFIKNEKLRNVLQLHWNDYVKTRKYIAIVEGKMPQDIGEIVSWLQKSETNLMYSSKLKKGQKSITQYKVLQENRNYSMLEVNIATGRKNQIRVHMKEAGHTIVGDSKYGPASDPLHRLGLHAQILTFEHPFNHRQYTFKAKIPACFHQLFQK